MSDSVIDETELLRRRNVALAKIEQLQAEGRPVAFVAESGDERAKIRFRELASEIADQRHVYNSAAAAAEHLKQAAADLREGAREAERFVAVIRGAQR